MTVAGEESVEPSSEPTQTPPLEPPPEIPERLAPSGRPERPPTNAVCPYLLAASGGWRSAAPHREHRCGAVDPPAPLSADKQRRLCLTLAHQTCPTYGAARTSRAAAIAPGVDPAVLAAAESARRPIARSAPVILEQPRIIAPRAGWPPDRGVSQAALVGLMIVAFALLAITRLTGGDVGAASISPSSAASVAVVASPSPSVPVTTPSPPPSEVVPSPSVGASASSAPGVTPTPAATFRTTYTVKSGDTLIGIASKFGTTVAAIRKLNGLTSNTIHTGQKLKIP
jgi:LysM repeat protein